MANEVTNANDTPAATAPRPPAAGLGTEVVVAAIVIGAMLALTSIRVGFGGAVVQVGG